MEAAYYKDYFHLERDHWYFRARNQIIMDHINKVVDGSNKLKILNVGAGTGFTSQLLEKHGRVKSLEYDEQCFDFVKEKLDIDIDNGSILELPYEDNAFDLVCAFDVIEHVEDDQLGVDELKRVCKKDGVVVVTVPAYQFLWSKHDEVNHHFKIYKKNQLLQLFGNSGKFIYHSYYNFWLFPPIAFLKKINNLFTITKTTDEDTGSDFGVIKQDSIVSKFLYRLFYSETFFVKRFFKLWFGFSLITSWKNN